MTRIVSVALGVLLILLVTALVAVWTALAMGDLPAIDTLRVFAMFAAALVAVFIMLGTVLVYAVRNRQLHLDALKNALRLRRPVTGVGEFGDLAFHVNALLEERERIGNEAKRGAESQDRDERLAELGRFAAGIAHEIRNPITNVIGFAALARERCDSDELRRDLVAIEEEARRCEAITDSITAFSRVPTIRPEAVELAALLVPPPPLEIEIKGVEEARRIMADRILLRRVFDNLLGNARDAGATRVAITLERRGANVGIILRDDGRGISTSILERLFEPFTTSRAGGLGLGLALARGIVAAHGGTIAARNRPEGGAEFEVILPVRGKSDIE